MFSLYTTLAIVTVLISGLNWYLFRRRDLDVVRDFRKLLNNTGDGYLLYQVENEKILFVNRQLSNWLGVANQNGDGPGPDQIEFPFFHGGDQTFMNIAGEVEKNGSWIGELMLRSADGTGSLFRASISGHKHPRLKLLWLVHLIDITEEKFSQLELKKSEEKWRTLFEILPVGVSILDANGKITELNQALEQILKITDRGLSQGAYKNRNYYNIEKKPFPLGDLPSLRAVREQSDIRDVEIGIEIEDGSIIWTQVSAAPLPFPDAKCVVVTQDITERKNSVNDLKESEERFRLFIRHSPLGILLTQPDGSILSANPACCRMLQMAEEEIIAGGRSSIVDTSDPRLAEGLKERMEKGEVHAKRLRMIRKNGEKFEAEVSSVIFMGEDGELFTSMILDDISERERMENQMKFLANYDQLTRLPNRNLLRDRMEYTLAVSRRTKKYTAVLFLDLDNFKILNDSYDHSVGDELLIDIAEKLRATLRETDTVARFGGDEFVVILEPLDSSYQEAVRKAVAIADKIKKEFAIPTLLTVKNVNANGVVTERSVEHRCTASIGVFVFNDHAFTTDEIIKYADRAMYESKAKGGNTVSIFTAPDK